MIKTVILDLGKVLVDFDFARGLERMSRRSACPPAEIRRRLADARLAYRYETGQLSSERFYREVCDLLSLEADFEEFCAIWNHIFLPDPLIPAEFLEGLRRHQKLVLLSNTNEIHFRYLATRYPLLGHFDSRVLSHEVGAAKPDPAIYEAAVRASGFTAPECFFADDVAENVEGARRAGLDAEQFVSLEKLRTDLAKRSIRWD
jgi:glucose-1-phosphatase